MDFKRDTINALENIDKKICRLCLNTIYFQTFNYIIDFVKVKLETIINNLNLDLTEHPIICCNCSKQLDCFYNFKFNCYKAEETIMLKICKIGINHKLDLKDVMFWTDNTPNPLKNKNINICRTCLHSFETLYSITENKRETFNLLKNNFPELDFNVTVNPDICYICRDILLKLESFKRFCTNSENYLTSYQVSQGFDVNQKVNIQKALEYNESQKWLKNNLFKSDSSSIGGIVEPVIKYENSLPNLKLEQDFLDVKNDVRKVDNEIFRLILYETAETVLKPIKRNGIYMYICPKCKKVVKNFDDHLSEHKDTNFRLMYHCVKCDFQIDCKEKIKGHAETHVPIVFQPDKTFACPYCSFRSKQKGNLLTHTLIHKKPEELCMFKCHLCKFQSRQKGNLKTHLSIHEDPAKVRMFQCNMCKYEARQKGNLQTHIVRKHRHAEEKVLEEALSHKCTECDYKVKQKSRLKKHMLTHSIS